MPDPKEFFATYCDFVTKVTSDPSLDIEALKASLESIQEESDIDVPRLMTAALGLSSEGGEFVEIVKKMFLQGKPANQDNIFHMKNIVLIGRLALQKHFFNYLYKFSSFATES